MRGRSVVKEDWITGDRLAARDMFICECNWYSLSLLYWYKSTDTDTLSTGVTANTCSATSRFSKRLCRMYASGVCLLAPSTIYQVGSVGICTFVLVKQVN